jgi:hypothetical protein
VGRRLARASRAGQSKFSHQGSDCLPRFREGRFAGLLAMTCARRDVAIGDPLRAGKEKCRTKPICVGRDSCELLCGKRVMKKGIVPRGCKKKANLPAGLGAWPAGSVEFEVSSVKPERAGIQPSDFKLHTSRKTPYGVTTNGIPCKTKPICLRTCQR